MAAVKPWYLSRTAWASIVAVLAGVAGVVGLPIDAADNAALVDIALQATAAISGLIAVFGRLSAKSRIG
jgi:hypothetical protein